VPLIPRKWSLLLIGKLKQKKKGDENEEVKNRVKTDTKQEDLERDFGDLIV
jgi:hypothetical protein